MAKQFIKEIEPYKNFTETTRMELHGLKMVQLD